jgi:hypothetical protein
LLLLNSFPDYSWAAGLSFDLRLEFGQLGIQGGELGGLLCQPLLQLRKRRAVINAKAFYRCRRGRQLIEHHPQRIRLGGSVIESGRILHCGSIGGQLVLQVRFCSK